LSKAIASQLEKALALQSAGETDAAQDLFAKVLKSGGNNAVAHHSMEAIESGRKNFDKALKFIQPVIVSHANFEQAHLAKSVILFNLGKFDDALNAAQKAIHVEPSLPKAQAHLDTVKLDKSMLSNGQMGQATSNVPIDPKVHVLTQQSIALQGQALHRETIEVDPNYTQPHPNKAALLQAISRYHDALLTLIASVEVDSNNVTAYEGQGQLLGQFRPYDLSANAFKRALEIDPNYSYGEGHLMHARLSCCDWTVYDEPPQRIFDVIRASKKVCSEMTIMSITDDAELARQFITIYSKDRYGDLFFKLWHGQKYAHRHKRVAFISADFRAPPVDCLLIEMIEKFDKEKFELNGVFAGTPNGSNLWKRHRCAFDHYLYAKNIPSYELAKLLRAIEIDKAIYLSGHTEGKRLDVLSHRHAPVQMTFLVCPGTLGLPFIDYLIADPRTIPPELQKHYAEKTVYRPHCYLPRDTSVVPFPITPKRSDFGLPDESFVFCSFNHDYKINPPMFKIWMELLKEVPGCILWLMKLNDAAHSELNQNAQEQGVNSQLIFFASRLPSVEDHLTRYRLADLFLDTIPYNGHTTVRDSLRAGRPVISLCGDSFDSRVVASLLHEIGITELICYSYDEHHKNQYKLRQIKHWNRITKINCKNKFESMFGQFQPKSKRWY
jgi:protein O-GlcNAc transferase